MTTVGPGLPPLATPARSAAPDGARSAQAAFFRSAMTGAQPVAPVAPIAPVSASGRAAEPAPDASARLTRPGALLDIRV